MFSSTLFFKRNIYFQLNKECSIAHSIDSSSLSILSPSLSHLQQIIHLNLFSYGKYFSILLSFFSYSLGEKKLQSNKLLAFNIKPINQIQMYLRIIESYAYIL